MKEELKTKLIAALVLGTKLDQDLIIKLVETPKNKEFGDFAFPCFPLAKTWQLSPAACAEKLSTTIVLPDGFSSCSAKGAFLNFTLNQSHIIRHIIETVSSFSNVREFSVGKRSPNKKNALVEYSSPNIAKPFHVGHLRATLIGNCLDRVYRHCGWNTDSINHLGDWGTQFGFVWAGCKLWGKPENPNIESLVDLYRKASSLKTKQEENKLDSSETELPNINEMARGYFLDLEKREPNAVKFWQWCLDISLKYLKLTYDRLGVSFDHYTGESFYSDKLEAITHALESSGLLRESQGAKGVDLGGQLGFARVLTPDGRSLYLTRDLAAAEYRAQTFNFDRAIYVVGAPQALHFQQLITILKLLSRPYADSLVHVAFGHVLGMKTRGEGEFIELNSFLDEAFQRSLAAYHEQVGKRPEGLDENLVANQVALSAIIFSNLSRARQKDVHFKWEHALEFQGDTGPYLLYACARINGIKEKALQSGLSIPVKVNPLLLSESSAYQLASCIADLNATLDKTLEDNEPNHLCAFALELAKAFSKAYLDLKVLGEEKNLAEARLALFEATRKTLGTTLQLLGITPLERM